MITRYSEFFLENLNKSKSIVKNKMDEYEKIKTLLNSNNALGYMGKFTEFLFNGVPYSEIETLYNNITDLKKRNLKIDIDSFNKYEDVLDEIAKKEITYKFKAIFNQFPKEQKELFNDPKDMDRDDIITISKLYDVEDYKPFMSKISRYKSEWELMKSVKRFLDGKIKSLTKEDIKSMLDDDLILMFENENILVLRTKTHESIVKIGSDTSWCIVNSSSTFKNYTSKGQTQYVIVDYTKDKYDTDHKIGFTLSKDNKMLYAHDILDKSIIAHTLSVLGSNKVNLNTINVPIKMDLTKFNKLTHLKDIEEALEEFGYGDVDFLKKVISILVYKFSRSKNGYESERMLRNIFYHIYKRKGDLLTMEEFDVYKEELGDLYDNIEADAAKNGYIQSNKAPSYIFGNADILLKNYKNWEYKLDVDHPSHYIDYVSRNHKFAEPIAYYASQNINDSNNLVIAYCNMVMGNNIDINGVKSMIDSNKEIDEDDKYKYYNYFGIKYRFDINHYNNMEPKYIIPEKIILRNTFNYHLLDKLINCDVTIRYTRKYMEESINNGFKLINYGKNNDVKITRKADNLPEEARRGRRLYYSNNASELGNKIMESFMSIMGSDKRRIVVRPDVDLPLSHDVDIKIDGRYPINIKLKVELIES